MGRLRTRRFLGIRESDICRFPTSWPPSLGNQGERIEATTVKPSRAAGGTSLDCALLGAQQRGGRGEVQRDGQTVLRVQREAVPRARVHDTTSPHTGLSKPLLWGPRWKNRPQVSTLEERPRGAHGETSASHREDQRRESEDSAAPTRGQSSAPPGSLARVALAFTQKGAWDQGEVGAGGEEWETGAEVG